ncbi:hypothetical protein O6H91_11G052600 [Diphasiastrum complanatum]|uniref:Uncharacterized protein n=1 Tax=Diphasiastrum complanatum TaxID=34168 RepID=A0ACC2C9B2_DIPCM|nr:hypothetical protein O6H91_11G052600 [Diphasiastrum complanatum]
MAKGASHVPEFGSWHSDDAVPFTTVFDQARAGKGGKMINPNDPAENLSGYQRTNEHEINTLEDNATISLRQSPLRRQIGASSTNCEESEMPAFNARGGPSSTSADLLRQSLTSQVIQNNGSEGGTHLNHQLNSDRSPLHPRARQVDRSPLHPRASQVRHGGRTGSASPAWDRKISAQSGPGTPERSRTRASTKTPEQPDKSSVPKFGAWNLKDPLSGDNITEVFDKARYERKSGADVGMHAGTPSTYEGLYKQPHGPHRSNRWCCCFQPTEVEA